MRNAREPAGDRNVLVSLEKNSPTTSDDGQKVAVWQKQFQRYAKVLTRTGRERRVFEQLRAEIDYLVRVPLDVETKQIKPADWRVTYHDGFADRVLNIGACYDVDSRHQTAELHCTEVVV